MFLLVSYETPAQECIKALAWNPEISVFLFNELYPLDMAKLKIILEQYNNILALEDHFASIGLFGKFCINLSIFRKLKSIAPKDYIFEVGSTNYYFHENNRYFFK